MNHYPPQVHEQLYYFNRAVLNWLSSVATGLPHPTLAGESMESARKDSDELSSLCSNVNLWVGARTMYRCSPLLNQLEPEVRKWCSNLESRTQIDGYYLALCKAVELAESTDGLSYN